MKYNLMEFNYIADGIDAIVIDNFYTEEQLSKIMIELKFLTKREILVGPEYLYTAENDHGSMASKTGIFLESVFRNPEHSALISYPKHNFLIKEVHDKVIEYNSLFRILYHCDSRSHLLSYYQNSDFYKAHADSTVFTLLNYFYTSPKKFTGGDIKLFSCNSSKVANIELRHNRVVLIPGCALHEVEQIKSEIEDEYSGDGRYCNAVFFNYPGLPRNIVNVKDKNDTR